MKSKEWAAFRARASAANVNVGWANFYINWRFPIGIFFSLAYCLMPLTEWMENKAIAGYRLNFPLVIVNAASLIATAIVYASMKKLDHYGYTLNMYYLAVTPFFMCMTTEIKLDTTTVIRFAIYFVIWTIPNYIYFKKREQLFINS